MCANHSDSHLPTLRISREAALPDGDLWINRFEIHSESSDRVYIISQNKAKRFWGCSCPSWRTRRRCKHLDAVGLPGGEVAHEVKIVK